MADTKTRGGNELRRRILDGITHDGAGKETHNTVFGEKITAHRKPKVMVQFQYGIGNDLVLSVTTANGGTATQADSMAVLKTSTATNGSVKIESREVVRYVPGVEGYVFMTMLFENGGVVGATQYGGLLNDEDGYFCGFDGISFVAGIRKDGSDTTEIPNLDSLDGRGPSGANIDFTKLNIFKIDYGWLGTAPVTYSIMGKDHEWVTFHKFDETGIRTNPHSTNPVLPIGMNVTKTSGDTDIVMKSASWHGGITSDENVPSDRFFMHEGDHPLSASAETVIINFRNMSTFLSKMNRVSLEFTDTDLVTDGNKGVTWRIYRNLTIGGTPSWSDVATDESVMEIDTAGTVTPDISKLIGGSSMGRIGDKTKKLDGKGLRMHPTDTFTITAQTSTGSSELGIFIRWREEF